MFRAKEHDCRKCSINEFNNILKSLNSRPKWINEDPEGKNPGPKVYLYDCTSKAYLVYNNYTEDGTTTKYYMTDLNDCYEDGYLEYIQPTSQHCAAISRAVKLPKLISNKKKAVVNASGILWHNKKYQKIKCKHYEYDMHLAWLTTFMNCWLPDTSKPMRTKDIVKQGEIGFLKDGLYNYKCGDTVVFEGDYADYIFPAMKAPNIKYFKRLVKSIDNEKHILKRKNKKCRFNEWLGSMQNHNPFIRVAVIAQSNLKIINLINKYKDILLFSVTDSLGSLERIPELDESTDWTIKGEGYLYVEGSNRLYLDENDYIIDATIRGVPKEYIIGLHINDYTSLVNKIDKGKNLYKLDFEKKEIIRNV